MAGELDAIKKNWVTIILAVISAGWFADAIGLVKFNKDISSKERDALLLEIKEDRDFYKGLYRDCSEQYEEIQSDLSVLKANIQLIGAIDNDLPVPFWLKDKKGRMLYFNKHYESTFLTPLGYEASDYLNNYDTAVWPKDVAQAFKINDLKAMQSETPLITTERVPNGHGQSEIWTVIKYKRKVGQTVVGVGGFAIKQTN